MRQDDAILLSDDEGRSVLRFERLLRHPRERVWRALTEPADLSSWHPTPFAFEPAVGGRVRYDAKPGSPEMPAGEVLDFDPPSAFAYTWGEDVLRFELAPEQGGCLLVLTHTFDDRFKAARDASGWHLCLQALAARLDGVSVPEADASGPIPAGWRELNSAYEAAFGIPPELATPPPY
jgi:uncharacterized protein YndB with AHSA1/START domain